MSMESSMELLRVLLASSLKGSLLLVIAFVTLRFMRRSSAASRHGVLAVALAAFLLFPFAQLVAPRWSLAILPEAPAEFTARHSFTGSEATPLNVNEQVRVEREPLGTVVGRGEHPASAGASAAGTTAAATSTPFDWRRALVLLWVAGAAAVVLRLGAGLLAVWLLARRATMVTDGGWLHTAHALAQRLGLMRGITLLRGDRGSVPLTWGVFQPVVWLPSGAGEWDAERRTVVLAHELAHVKRRDALTQWIANITLALHWFNPLAWVAARQLRVERERACDDAVLSLGTMPTVYAEHLLALVRSLGSQDGPAAAMAMARRSQFEGRLLAILDGAAPRRGPGAARLGIVAAAALLLMLPLAGMTPAVRTAADIPGTHSESGGYPAAVAVDRDSTSPSLVARAAQVFRAQPRRDVTAPPPADQTAGVALTTPPPIEPSEFARSAVSELLRETAEGDQAIAVAVTSDSSLIREILLVAGEISSPSARALVLTRIARLTTLDSQLVDELLRVTASISSPSSKGEVLAALARHQPHALRTNGVAYADVVATVSSPSTQGSLLTAMMSGEALPVHVVERALRSAGRISSSSSRSSVLTSAVKHQPAALGSLAPVLLALVDSVASSSDRSAVLRKVIAHEPMTVALMARTLESVDRVASSSDRAALLRAAAVRGHLTGDAKAAYLRAARRLSSSDQASVLQALLPDDDAAPSAPAAPAAPRVRIDSDDAREASWYIVRDTTNNVERTVTVSWRGMELRNGEMVNLRAGGLLEAEEKRVSLAGRGMQKRRVIVRVTNGTPEYEYCVNDDTRPFDDEARAWMRQLIASASHRR